MEYISILGRQPKLGLAELIAQFGEAELVSPNIARFFTDDKPDINRFGGILKIAKKLDLSPEKYLSALPEGKIVFGVSDYSKKPKSGLGLRFKKYLKAQERSARVLLPDRGEFVLSTATAHHNQLGEKPTHVELIFFQGAWYVGVGVQNITAYAKRDQARPARDAKVGMLPPKLAQILINLCGPLPEGATILDPFCGTGVVLQEAARMNYKVYGTDKNERMVDYTNKNLKWADVKEARTEVGDATNHTWQGPISAVAAETYLGPPMSKPPVSIKLKEVEQECGAIVRGFLKNLSSQIAPGTPVVIAVPAWALEEGTSRYHRLKTLDEVDHLGYNVEKYHGISQEDLLYFRPGQVVAREIIVLRKR